MYIISYWLKLAYGDRQLISIQIVENEETAKRYVEAFNNMSKLHCAKYIKIKDKSE